VATINGVIVERLQRLRSYVSELLSLQGEVTFEVYQQDKFKRKFIERTLHTALEASLDIGNRLIAAKALRQPETDQDVFVILSEAGVLPAERLDTYKRMAGFRNILVHEYARLDDAAVFGVFQRRLQDLVAFADAVTQSLQPNDGGSSYDSGGAGPSASGK
jgi:uncharacterized protein YutE (UPF0331/DUF86 family)